MYLGFFAMCLHAAHIRLKKYSTDVLQVISALLQPNIQQTRIGFSKILFSLQNISNITLEGEI